MIIRISHGDVARHEFNRAVDHERFSACGFE
jgi:hypothetical protein